MMGFDTSLQKACGAIVTLDILGLFNGWRFLDHAGHLGGAAFGLMFAYWIRAQIPVGVADLRLRRRIIFERQKYLQVQRDEHRVFDTPSKATRTTFEASRDDILARWRTMIGGKRDHSENNSSKNDRNSR
mmetsp:Transcript_12588/g.22693  ORF Transcript_12588/g.22693 Transcript_12588/m.22693 type:complete len:130 (-) Transcript_12588:795-1184(-)